MAIHFEPPILKRHAITYIDDTILQSHKKVKLFSLIKSTVKCPEKQVWKLLQKTFFFLEEANLLGTWDTSSHPEK